MYNICKNLFLCSTTSALQSLDLLVTTLYFWVVTSLLRSEYFAYLFDYKREVLLHLVFFCQLQKPCKANSDFVLISWKLKIYLTFALDEGGEMLPVSACATTTSVTTGGVTTTVYMRQPISGHYNFCDLIILNQYKQSKIVFFVRLFLFAFISKE